MSRGFVREGDQEEEPIIAERAPLPEGLPNHVTSFGMQLLEEERAALESEKQRHQSIDSEKHRVDIRVIDIKLAQLIERINSAQVSAIDADSLDEVRFGCRVKYTLGTSQSPVEFQIVGVDEADVKEGKIAFTSPIASALIGMKLGEEKEFELGIEKRKLKLVGIS